MEEEDKTGESTAAESGDQSDGGFDSGPAGGLKGVRSKLNDDVGGDSESSGIMMTASKQATSTRSSRDDDEADKESPSTKMSDIHDSATSKAGGQTDVKELVTREPLNGAEKLIRSKGSSAESKGVGSLGDIRLKTSKTREGRGDFFDGDADFDEERTIGENVFDNMRGADDDINEVRGPETLEPHTKSSKGKGKGKGSDSRKSKSGSKKSGKGKTSASYSKKSMRSPVLSAPSGAPLYSPSPAGSVSPSPTPA